VHLALHKQIYSRSDADADSRAQQFSPAVTTNGYTVSINMPSLDGARGDLVITVPAAATVSINANRGDIHVASIKAPVTATANHGDVELSAITGPAKVRINSGGSSFAAHNIDGGVSIQGHAEDVTVSDITGPVAISGEFFGTTHLERINGATHFHTSRTDLQLARLDGQVEISPNMDLSADQAMGPVVLTTRDRNITLERIAGDIAVTNRDGRIVLTAAPVLGNITLEDRNGSVSTTLPEKASFTVQADTSDGSVDTDFALTTRSSENGRSLSGTVGSGGPVVHITTTDGDITVRKGEVQPLPVAAPAPPKITLTPPTAPAAPKAAKTPKAAPAN